MWNYAISIMYNENVATVLGFPSIQAMISYLESIFILVTVWFWFHNACSYVRAKDVRQKQQ